LSARDALEVLDMGGDELRVLVGEHSRGTMSIIAGLMHGGPPLHTHEDEDE
jgi:hypothetical protein